MAYQDPNDPNFNPYLDPNDTHWSGDPGAPFGYGHTDPTSDARRAAYRAQNPAPDMQIDTTGLQVSPDINGSYTGYLNINGAPTRISVTPDGQVYDETGREISSRFSPENLSAIRGAYAQGSGDPQFSQSVQQSGGQNGSPETPGGGSNTGTPSGGESVAGGGNAPVSLPNYTGFVPFDPRNAPNSGYLSRNPGGDPNASGYQNFRYGYSGQPVNGTSLYGYGIQPYLDQSGNNIDTKIANDRAMAYSRGSQIGQDLTNYTNYNQGRASDYEDQLQSAFDPSNPANAGYTDAEKNAMLNDPYLRSLQLGPEQQQSNYLTEGEQQGIYGDPYAAWNYASTAANQLDQENNDFNGTIRQALNDQTGAINSGVNNTANSLRNAVSNQFGSESSYVDPSKLTTSQDYLQNYNFGPQDIQALKDQAGAFIGNQEKADEDRLNLAANQQGNVNPLALATMRDRLRQTGAINSANAMTNAAIQGKQLQLGTTQGRENTRLGAEQGYANTGIGVASDLGAAARGAEQYLGNQNQQAQQYLGSSRIGAEQSNAGRTVSTGQFNSGLDVNTLANADAQSAARQSSLAGNRQATNQYNQGQDFTRGQYIYNNEAGANTNFANARLGQLGGYRGYLTGQNTQANQNVNLGQNQIGQNYGTMLNGANQASGNAVTNSKTPGFGNQVFSDVMAALGTAAGAVAPHAKGGEVRGPQLALVGESGPELILSLPHYGSGYDPRTGDYNDSDAAVNPYTSGSGETDYEGSDTPGGSMDPRYADRNQDNPLWKRLIGALAPKTGFSTSAEVDPSAKPYDPFGPHGGPAGVNLLNLGIRAATGKMAKGGMVSPHHPYGHRGMPKMELVTKPQIRVLGAHNPEAVVPLTRRPGNHLDVEDIPGLLHQYGG